jgi:hypothetical protein
MARCRRCGICSARDAERLNVIGDGRDVHAVIVASLVGLFGSTTPDVTRIESQAKKLGDYLEHKRAEPSPETGTDAAQEARRCVRCRLTDI